MGGIGDAAFGFAGLEGLALAEGHFLGEDGGVGGDGDVLMGYKEEPEVVVAEGGAGTDFEVLVPPMEDVSFGELVGCVVEDLATGVGGVAVEE